MTAHPDSTPTARPDAHERAEVEQERWPMDLPLVPCSGCGSTAASKHVYGVRKCCPDCSHDLAAHDAEVLRATANDLGDWLGSSDLMADEISDHGIDVILRWLRERADQVEHEGRAEA